jgi:hypothetical protein
VLTTHDSLAACYTVQQYIDESIEKLQQCQRIVRGCVWWTGIAAWTPADVPLYVCRTHRRWGSRRPSTSTSKRTSSSTRSRCSRICGSRSAPSAYDIFNLECCTAGLRGLTEKLVRRSLQGQLFPQRMNDWMHVAMETIKEEAKRSASTWLENIRAASMVRRNEIDASDLWATLLTD